jgi:hypothetical protein
VTDRKRAWLRIVLLAGAAAAWIARAAINGTSDLLIVLGAALVLSAAVWTYAIQQARRTFAGTADLWDGLVAYRRTDLERAHISTLRVKRVWLRRLLGMDNAFGRMEVRGEGIYWRPNRWWSLGFPMAKGSFLIPWSEVAETSVEDAPGKVSSLGGRVVIHRRNGSPLSGEFLGSQHALRDALANGSSTSDSDNSPT